MFIIFLHISYSFELSDTINHTHQRVRPLSVKTLFLYERLTRNLWLWSYLQHWNRDPHSRREHHIAVVVGISSVCVRALLSFRGIRLFESARRPWQTQHVSIEAVRERLPCSMLRPLESSWMMLFNVARSPTSKAEMRTSVDQEWRHWKMSSCSPRAMKFHAPGFNSTSSEKFDHDVWSFMRQPLLDGDVRKIRPRYQARWCRQSSMMMSNSSIKRPKAPFRGSV